MWQVFRNNTDHIAHMVLFGVLFGLQFDLFFSLVDPLKYKNDLTNSSRRVIMTLRNLGPVEH